jgi:hypothetical protein
MKSAVLLCLAAGFLLGGCMMSGKDLQSELEGRVNDAPTPNAFDVCYAHGCSKSVAVSLTPTEWADVTYVFNTPAVNARDERRQLAYALARVEQIVGEQTGLSSDVGGSFNGMGKSGPQLDCVDEMLNTATYLAMFERERRLKFHAPHRRVTQSFFANRGIWPHTVSTILEEPSGTEYVIDMWIKDHGELPYIMPIADWDDGKPLAYHY